MSSPPPHRSRIEVENIGDVTVVGFVDKRILDGSADGPVTDALIRLVDELGRRKVLLDFSNLKFMGSATMGRLITLHRKLLAVQGKLVLCNVAPDMLDVFRITKLDKIFTIVTNPNLGIDDVIGEAFGNPFRAAFSPELRTSTAVAIARGVDDSRDLDVLPILADALQDAGCDNEEILAICRRSHARGCWVVDLVLGKE